VLRHLGGGQRRDVVAGRRRDLALDEPAVDRVRAQRQRLVDRGVRFAEQGVVRGAEELACSVEQAIELGVELGVHSWTLTCGSRPG